jgi:hypothetical protein
LQILLSRHKEVFVYSKPGIHFILFPFLQETFDPIIQITTGRDLIPAMVYGYGLVSTLFTCITRKSKLWK